MWNVGHCVSVHKIFILHSITIKATVFFLHVLKISVSIGIFLISVLSEGGTLALKVSKQAGTVARKWKDWREWSICLLNLFFTELKKEPTCTYHLLNFSILNTSLALNSEPRRICVCMEGEDTGSYREREKENVCTARGKQNMFSIVFPILSIMYPVWTIGVHRYELITYADSFNMNQMVREK